MRHVTFGDKSLLIGDEAADLLLEYAAALANVGRADTVRVNAIGADGDEVVANLLLDTGAPLMSETSTSPAEEPGNAQAIEYLSNHIALIRRPPMVVAEERAVPEDFTDFDQFASPKD